MALLGTDAALSAAFRTAILGANCGAIDGPELTGLCDALAQTMVSHLIANITVLPTTLGVPTLLSAAPGAPVTGVGEIT